MEEDDDGGDGGDGEYDRPSDEEEESGGAGAANDDGNDDNKDNNDKDNNDDGDDEDEDDDLRLSQKDLDTFLTSVESRLRAAFSSLDLTKIVAAQGHGSQTLPDGSPSSPARYLRLVARVFDRMVKPIKLRCLIALLGLEPDASTGSLSAAGGVGMGIGSSLNGSSVANGGTAATGRDRRNDVNRIVWDMLTDASIKDDDEWIRTVAGAVRGRMFRPRRSRSRSKTTRRGESSRHGKGGTSDNNGGGQAGEKGGESCRGKDIDSLFRRTAESILKRVATAASDAASAYRAAEEKLLPDSDDDHDDLHHHHAKIKSKTTTTTTTTTTTKKSDGKIRDDDERARLLESYMIEGDAAPLFGPFGAGLLPPNELRLSAPEAFENPHFAVAGDGGKGNAEGSAPASSSASLPSILKEDEEMERSKAEEEQRELEQRERLKKMAKEKGTAGQSGAGGGNSVGAAGRGGVVSRASGAAGGRVAMMMAAATAAGGRAGIAGRGPGGRMAVGAGRLGIGAGRGQGGRGGGRGGPIMPGRAGMMAGRAVGGRPMGGRISQGGRAAEGRGEGATEAASLFARARASREAAAGRGRGAAAAALGKSLATPMQRRIPMMGRNASSVRSLVGGRRGAVATGAGGGGAPRIKSKMKMMDMSEVRSLAKEHKKREGKLAAGDSREAKKRRIMEAAAARGLKTKGKLVLNQRSSSPDDDGDDDDNDDDDDDDDEEEEEEAEEEEEEDGAREVGTDLTSDDISGEKEDTASVASEPRGAAEVSSMEATASLFLAAEAASSTEISDSIASSSQLNSPPVPAPAAALQHFSGLGDDAGLIAMALSAYQQQEHVATSVDPLTAYQQYAQSTPATNPSEKSPVDETSYLAGARANPMDESSMHHNWQQLLEKSNKLSAEDRFRIEQFFTDRFNPTPNILIHKIKLNEEKTLDPSTGLTVKETLYLELDYNTYGLKMLRKIKKK